MPTSTETTKSGLMFSAHLAVRFVNSDSPGKYNAAFFDKDFPSLNSKSPRLREAEVSSRAKSVGVAAAMLKDKNPRQESSIENMTNTPLGLY